MLKTLGAYNRSKTFQSLAPKWFEWLSDRVSVTQSETTLHRKKLKSEDQVKQRDNCCERCLFCFVLLCGLLVFCYFLFRYVLFCNRCSNSSVTTVWQKNCVEDMKSEKLSIAQKLVFVPTFRERSRNVLGTGISVHWRSLYVTWRPW